MMGGLVDSLFGGGGKKQMKKSLALQQQMYGDTKATLSPFSTTGGGLFSDYAAMLQGGPQQEEAFKNYLNSSDYKFAQGQGIDALTSSAASKGQLKSGAFAKGITDFGQQLGMRYRDNYMNKQMAGAQVGLNAASAMAGANQNNAQLQTNTRQQMAENQQGGFNNFLNFGMSAASLFSDRRLKHAIRRVGELAGGLGLYEFSYIGSARRWIGVMADEVRRLRPAALGPRVGGFDTVNYGRL